MDEDELRRRVGQARVARVGTVDEQERAHLVPIVFVSTATGSTRPPTTARARPSGCATWPATRATVLVDVYDEDWARVWWVRLAGRGRTVTDAGERANALALLWEKYPQFGDAPPEEAAGPVMAVDIERWSGWAYAD
jgi:nitroimidazol reductase NimA-like FMN-containing flavoprotein (pyridoxamine 5'-phosphate oxidase superfamily)